MSLRSRSIGIGPISYNSEYVSRVISLNNYFGHNVKSISSEFDFITTMAGIRRVVGDPTSVRPSFTIKDLEMMYKYVDLDSAEDRCMWACLVLSFGTFHSHRCLIIHRVGHRNQCILIKDSAVWPKGI